jgi:hypothetical protein
MRKIRSHFLAALLVTGIGTGALAKLGPSDACNVNTRMELDMLCPPGTPICCQFLQTTRMLDTNEVFYQGQYVYGWYTPFD